MKVGIALDMLTKEGHSDAAVFAEHMALGDLAEPLGFDLLFAVGHHSSSRRTSGPSPRPTTCASSPIASLPVLRRDPAFAGDSIDAPAGMPVTPKPFQEGPPAGTGPTPTAEKQSR